MPGPKLCFSQTLLWLALTCAIWPGSSLPYHRTVDEKCYPEALKMLSVIQEALTKEQLHKGMNSRLDPELNMSTQTATVCRPEGFACSGDAHSGFNKDSCLENIGQDLVYYRNFLSASSYPVAVLDAPVLLESLQRVIQNCVPWTSAEELPRNTAVAKLLRFDEREALAKRLRGFEVRAITIARALGYMCAAQ